MEILLHCIVRCLFDSIDWLLGLDTRSLSANTHTQPRYSSLKTSEAKLYHVEKELKQPSPFLFSYAIEHVISTNYTILFFSPYFLCMKEFSD